MDYVNKLVRDGILDRLKQEGKTVTFEILSDDQYLGALNNRFVSAISEYLESGTLEDLVEIGEVMHGILAFKGISVEEFQKARMEMLEKLGSYKGRILIKEITENK
jgi:predicted house-cleaning noncanonical NTP pyrophosphatase (MazG superfamily)